MKKLALASLTAVTLGVSSTALLAEDLGQVKIGHDKDVAARTNMPSREGTKPGDLTVTFDKDVAARTNMKRPTEPPKAVGITRDQDVQERTNMLGKEKSVPTSHAATTKK